MASNTEAIKTTLHDVWRPNLEEEFAKIRELVKDYPYVAMDTEFPGIVATPIGTFRSKEDFHYQMLLCNVNMLKLIQVGFVLVNEKGELPPNGDIWQFNFQFSLNDDVYAQESVELLRKAGIDFARTLTDGISMEDFGELLTTSGLIVDDKITWLTFSSGYDFGYLLKAITLGELPKEEGTFFQYHRALFPRSYDVKALLKLPACTNAKLKGGLQEIADQLDVKRVGTSHTAGSDALLTARTFFKLKHQFFADNWDRTSALILGQMHGLGSAIPNSLSARNLEEFVKEPSIPVSS